MALEKKTYTSKVAKSSFLKGKAPASFLFGATLNKFHSSAADIIEQGVLFIFFWKVNSEVS